MSTDEGHHTRAMSCKILDDPRVIVLLVLLEGRSDEKRIRLEGLREFGAQVELSMFRGHTRIDDIDIDTVTSAVVKVVGIAVEIGGNSFLGRYEDQGCRGVILAGNCGFDAPAQVDDKGHVADLETC